MGYSRDAAATALREATDIQLLQREGIEGLHLSWSSQSPEAIWMRSDVDLVFLSDQDQASTIVFGRLESLLLDMIPHRVNKQERVRR